MAALDDRVYEKESASYRMMEAGRPTTAAVDLQVVEAVPQAVDPLVAADFQVTDPPTADLRQDPRRNPLHTA